MTSRLLQWALLLLLAVTVNACQKPSETGGRGVEQVTSTVTPESFGKYHALVIGINEYKIWPKLKYARRDAENIGKELTAKYTFEPGDVTYLLDEQATLENIMRELRKKLESLGDKDNLLIYYAGHGQLDPLTEAGYWIPVDGKLAVESSWIMFTTLQALLAATNVKAKNIILLTDSCYGGALTRGAPTPGNKSPEETGYAQYEQRLKTQAQKRSRQVIASGGADVTVPDRSDFAQLFIASLQSNKYPVTDMEMLFFRDVYPQLRFSGQQDPIITRVAPRPGEDGQFVLVKRGTGTDVAATATTTDTTAPRGQEPVTAQKGTITVQSNVSDDTVFINDQPKGSTQLNVEMDPGSYSIRVEKSGYSSYSQRIDLAAGDKLVVKAQLQPLQSPLPVIEVYQANTNEIEAGGSATLEWRTKNATSVEIKGLGNVALSGKADVTPAKTARYTLVATSAQGKQASAEVTIKVQVVSPPVITAFTATPAKVTSGETVRLEWQTANADSVFIEGVGTVAVSGSVNVTPAMSTRYQLVAKNRQGQTIDKLVVVTVRAASPAPKIISFSASKTTITPGEAITLSWQTENATRVVIKPLGNAAAQGSQTINPQTATTYTLIAISADGQHVEQALAINIGSGEVTPAVNQCPYGADQCLPGYVWREAFTGDRVCVTPEVRKQTALDNRLAASRRSPTGGAYGPDTCLQGFVWREASPTDHVCVTGTTRDQARRDNAAAASRRDPKCAPRVLKPLRLERLDAPKFRIQP